MIKVSKICVSYFILAASLSFVLFNTAWSEDKKTMPNKVNSEKTPVIVFVSFSMPDESLRSWMREAGRINAPVVIRGLINNSFKETTAKVSGLIDSLPGHLGGIQLDPTLFEKFNIKKVPAVIVQSESDYDVIYGNVTLEYALKKIVDENDSLSQVALNNLNHYRAGK